MAESLNCPNCGSALARGISYSKVVTCDSCGSTVFLEDNAFRSAGECGEMHGGPEFLALGAETSIGKDSYLPVGVIRYSYGRGWWDEFWCRDQLGEGIWISVDEGDIVIEREVPEGQWPLADNLEVGQSVRYQGEIMTVQESEEAECLAFRGELPEAPVLGEKHHFRNLIGDGGTALCHEVWEGGETWYAGRWVDPFDIAVRREDRA